MESNELARRMREVRYFDQKFRIHLVIVYSINNKDTYRDPRLRTYRYVIHDYHENDLTRRLRMEYFEPSGRFAKFMDYGLYHFKPALDPFRKPVLNLTEIYYMSPSGGLGLTLGDLERLGHVMSDEKWIETTCFGFSPLDQAYEMGQSLDRGNSIENFIKWLNEHIRTNEPDYVAACFDMYFAGAGLRETRSADPAQQANESLHYANKTGNSYHGPGENPEITDNGTSKPIPLYHAHSIASDSTELTQDKPLGLDPMADASKKAAIKAGEVSGRQFGKLNVFIYGGTSKDRIATLDAAGNVFRNSNQGKAELAALESRKKWFGFGGVKSFDIMLVDRGGSYTYLGSQGMVLDRNDIGAPYPSLKPGGVFTRERILAHELGHAAMGVCDDGPDNMRNVIKNENTIMKELGDDNVRVSY